MNTCGTCRYFGRRVDSFDSWDEDGNELRNTRFHKCMLLAHLNHSGRTPPCVPAGVIAGRGDFAALCVSDEFGCNQWAARE